MTPPATVQLGVLHELCEAIVTLVGVKDAKPTGHEEGGSTAGRPETPLI